MRNITKKTSNQTSIKLWVLLIFICFPALYEVGKLIVGSASIAHSLLVISCYLPFIYVIIKNKGQIKSGVFWLILILMCIIGYYAVINLDKDYLFESWALPSTFTLFSGVMGFVFITIQDDAEKTTKIFKLVTVILFLYYANYALNIDDAESYQWGYDMFLGYRILLPTILSLHFLLDNQKTKIYMRILWGIIFALSVFIIISYGSRGPFIAIVVYILVKYCTMFMNRKDISLLKKLVVNIALIALAVVLSVNFEAILISLSDFMEAHDISSRTIRKLLQDNALDDNGRNALFSEAISMFNFIGHGPYSDQYYFGQGNYCHNFIIEIFFDFGYIFGIIIMVFLVYHLYKIIRDSTRTEWFGLFAVFFSYCLGRLMFSGTFWAETNFWVMLGLGYLCENDARRKGRK